MDFLSERLRYLRPEDDPDAVIVDKVSDPSKLTHLVMHTNAGAKQRGYRWLRLSELDGCCPREWVIGHVKDAQIVERPNWSVTCVREIGQAFHSWVQNNPFFFGDTLVGYWFCKACGKRRRFGVRPKERCEFCKALPNATVYDEYIFRIESPYRVVGKADAILRIGSGIHRFAEIKHVGRDVTSPLGKDVTQLASYIYFSQFDDSLPISIDRSVGYLIYFKKVFDFRTPVMTFQVKPTKDLIERIADKAERFTKGITTGELPPVLNVCETSEFMHTRAKNCQRSNDCKILRRENSVWNLRGIGSQPDQHRNGDNPPGPPGDRAPDDRDDAEGDEPE